MAKLQQGTIGWNLTYSVNGDGIKDLAVHGLVNDDVSAVRMLFESNGNITALNATLGGNAFFADAERSSIDRSSIAMFDLRFKGCPHRQVPAGESDSS